MEVFVVGQWAGESWELTGVFDTEAGAEAACLNATYFMGPVTMNEAIHETKPWVGCRFPKE